MIKRTLTLGISLAMALLALLVASIPAVAATSIAVRVDAPGEVVEDTDFTVNVYVTNLTSFDAGQFDVSFNESMLRLDGATPGLVGTTQIPVVGCNRIGTGKYRVVVNVSGVPGVNGSGSLAVLHYHAVGAAGGSSAIDLSDGFLNNNLGAEITATWAGDSVAITKSLDVTTTSLPSSVMGGTYSSTLGATGGNGNYSWSLLSGCLPAGLSLSATGVISGVPTGVGDSTFFIQVADGHLAGSRKFTISVTARIGDANGDGQVNTSDITAVERIIVEIDGPTAAADVNRDSETNTADVTSIERIIVGLA